MIREFMFFIFRIYRNNSDIPEYFFLTSLTAKTSISGVFGGYTEARGDIATALLKGRGLRTAEREGKCELSPQHLFDETDTSTQN